MKLFCFCTALFCAQSAQADPPDYDEVAITLRVPRIGQIEITAVIREEMVYLPVGEVFDFLHIKNAVSVQMDSIKGSFINPEAEFLIDKSHNRIVYMTKVYELQPDDMIATAAGIYLKSDYFGKIFGLNCVFSFRNLSVLLTTELELPLIREMRQEQMRTNVNKLRGVAKSDTLIGRSYPMFHFGTADYSIVNSTYGYGGAHDTRIGLGLGGIVAGGETNVLLNYDTREQFRERQQYYLWRFVNNDNTAVRQISAGKIFGQAISSIYAPLVGVQVTNTPTTYRRSFGSYNLSNYTEPNWIVELYVNGVLITYVKADAAGFYTFNVPLVYGNSIVKLRFYGPYGEERSSEQIISIPFNFLPKKEFEYIATTGIIEDDHHSRFSRISANYGLNKNITIGGGTEYLSSITTGTTIPFINSSIRVLSNLFLSGEYDHNVRSKAVLSYTLSSGLQIELNNTWYKSGQTAISNTYVEDRKLSLLFPFKGRGFSAYSRVTLQQIVLPQTKYLSAAWLLTTVFGNYNASVNTYGFFINDYHYIYSDYSIGTRVFKNILLTQQVQYEYVANRVVSLKTNLEKRVFKNGYLNVSYEKNISSQITNTQVGLRYNFSFAQAGVSVRRYNDDINYLQSVNGSLIYDHKSKFVGYSNYNSVGAGAVILIPFVDINGNGKRDGGEPAAQGLKIHVNGGRVKQNTRDTTISITNMEAYVNYNIELDSTGFDRVAWRLPKKNYGVIVDPNLVKRIEIPIRVFGEASGMVTLKSNNGDKGLGPVFIEFYNDRSVLVARTVSEVDGYFTYLGLPAGSYFARIDSAQLAKLHLVSLSGPVPFTISRSSEGTIVDGLEITLKAADNPVPIVNDVVPVVNDAPPIVDSAAHTEIQINVPLNKSSKTETIQTAHFKIRNALKSQKFLSKYNYTVILVKADKPYFNVRIIGVINKSEAKSIIQKIKHLGYPDAYIWHKKVKKSAK